MPAKVNVRRTTKSDFQYDRVIAAYGLTRDDPSNPLAEPGYRVEPGRYWHKHRRDN